MITALSTIAAAGFTGGAGPGFGLLFFILIPLFWFTVLAVLFAVFGRRWRRERFQHAGWAAPTRSAESSLAERFAQGDIDEKEYRARLEVLRTNNSPEARG